ncbi:flagellar FLiS export co-chaperone [Helicobacter sp. 11S02629-2]|uniref:flagellar FLiS export co-chaperone n=1 Tax=Helicobacter sp. 11S02629-2 TaxID=1476195 RepID=UPI000BA596B7|nr:flagellar FLiS export co-chaperone [Helicobacter sp. 11S02629-2]PAF44644.1 hypothetical protein BKH40_05295 [Helicobacter sp. 11S02629-2]
MDKMLQTLKKHLDGLDTGTNLKDSLPSQVSTYRFGEGMKAINELVGCLQVLRSKLNKLSTLVSKMEFGFEDRVPFEADTANTGSLLMNQARELIAGARFVDKELFDANLNASLSGVEISFEMDSPLPLLESKNFKTLNAYIASKKDEISMCMNSIRTLSELDSMESSEAKLAEVSAADILKVFQGR